MRPRADLASRARRWLDIRKGERPAVVQAFGVLVGLIAIMAVLQTARDALFLSRLGPRGLPVLDLVIGSLALVLGRLPRRRALAGHARLIRFLSWSAAGATVLWIWMPHAPTWAAPILYVATSLFGIYGAYSFWVTASERFAVDQAQRLYGVIGAGAVIGAVCGSTLAAALATVLAARHLIVIAAALMVLTAVGVALGHRSSRGARQPASASTSGSFSASSSASGSFAPIVSTPSDPTSTAGLGTDWHRLRDPYILRLGLLMTAAAMVLTVGDYWFKASIDARVADENLAMVFGTIYAVGSTVGLLVQLGLTSWLLRHVGAPRSLLLLPVLIAAAAVIGLAGWVLVAAATVKTADLSLRHTQMRSALEVMLLPLPTRLRERAKRLIELVLYRAAQAATALMVLVGLQVAPLELLPLLESLLVIGVIGWLVAAWQTRRGYLQAFVRSLTGPGGLDLDRVEIDGASRRELRQALASSDPMVVRLALRLIERRRRYKLVPTALLEHPDPAVAEHAAVLIASVPLGAPRPRRRRRLGDRDLVSRAQDTDPRVRAEAARAMGVHGSSRFLPHLLVLLADHRTRAPAREATVAIGDRALPYLVRALRDPTLPHAVRLHVPRTLARFDVRRVGPILLRQVAIERDGAVLYKLLRALGSLRRQEPNLGRRSSALRRALRQNLALAGRLEHRRRQMQRAADLDPELATRTHDLLLDLLAAKRDNTLERVLRLIDLERPRLDLLRLLPAARAPARRAPLGSMLGEALPGRLAESMRWLFDPGAPVPTRRVVGPHLETEPTTYPEVLGVLAEDESRSLSTLARVRLAELELPVAPSPLRRPDRSGSRTTPPWLLLRQVTAWIEQGPRRLPA